MTHQFNLKSNLWEAKTRDQLAEGLTFPPSVAKSAGPSPASGAQHPTPSPTCLLGPGQLPKERQSSCPQIGSRPPPDTSPSPRPRENALRERERMCLVLSPILWAWKTKSPHQLLVGISAGLLGSHDSWCQMLWCSDRKVTWSPVCSCLSHGPARGREGIPRATWC